MYSSGYATRWYNEPEPTKIIHEVPIEYRDKFPVRDCIEKDGAICPIEAPRWIIPDNEYKRLSGYIGGLRLHYNECDRLIQTYNEKD